MPAIVRLVSDIAAIIQDSQPWFSRSRMAGGGKDSSTEMGADGAWSLSNSSALREVLSFDSRRLSNDRYAAKVGWSTATGYANR